MEGFQIPLWLLHTVTRGCCGQHTPQHASAMAARNPGQAMGPCGLHLLVPDRVAAPRILQPINSLILIS